VKSRGTKVIATPSPELLSQVAAAATSPPKAAPGGAGQAAEAAADPFADLLSGLLAGARPLAPVAEPLPLAGVPLLATNDLPDADAGTQALLALPASAAPLPALPVGQTSAGNSLPVAGNPLPGDPSLQADPRIDVPVPLQNPKAAHLTPAPGETRSRISLTDLTLSRQLEPAPEGIRTTGPAGPALAFARKYLTPESPTQSVAPPTTTGPSVPTAGTEFAAGMLAALTTGSASNSGLPGPVPLAATGGAGSGNGALAARQDSGVPPALTPLGDAASFAGGLADRLLTLGGAGVQTARLQLHPEQLGALTVRIQIEDGTAQVWFGTSTSQAHTAIEGSLPKLRELFADQGIVLTRTQVDVGAGQLGNSASDQQRRSAGSPSPDLDRPWRPASPARSPSIPFLSRLVGVPSRRLDVWA
jgi:flagellar hook-length control protein FliK